MYCFVTAISTNSRSTAAVAFSSTAGRRLISVESVSISFSSRLLKIFAEASAPIVARKMAALRAPLSVSVSTGIVASASGGLQVRGGFRLFRRHRDGALADVVALATQREELFGHDRRRRHRRHGRGRR